MIKHASRHARLLESFKGHRMNKTLQAELNEFAALSYTKLTEEARGPRPPKTFATCSTLSWVAPTFLASR
jgi:hypothetical protein